MKIGKKVLVGLFTAAVIGIGAFASGDMVLKQFVGAGNHTGAAFATNVLQARPDFGNAGLYVLSGNLDAVRVMMELLEDTEENLFLSKAEYRNEAYRTAALNRAYVAHNAGARQANAEEMMELIRSYADDEEEAQAILDNALERIIDGDDLAMMEYLLQQGANANAVSNVNPLAGPRTLAWAVLSESEKKEEVVDLLLRYDADIRPALDYLNGPQFENERQFLMERVRLRERNAEPTGLTPS